MPDSRSGRRDGAGRDDAGRDDAGRDDQGSLLLANWRLSGGASSEEGPGRRYDLRLEDGLIVDLGASLAHYPLDRRLDLDGAYLLPGLIDCHVHLSLGGADVPSNARAHLACGVTAVRSLGDRDGWQAARQDGHARARGGRSTRAEGEQEALGAMPRAVMAGRALAPAGRYGGFLGREVQPGEALGRLVEEEVSRGAEVIKVILSGSVDFERGTVDGPYFDQAQLTEIVAAASSLGVPVACHANGSAAVCLAAAAGVASIEHGILAGDEGLRAMAQSGSRWVPTLTPLHTLSGDDRYPGLPAILRGHLEAVRRGAELGVVVLPGTDAGSPGVPHGSLQTELSLLRDAGFSAGTLLEAAGWRAAELLGLPRGQGLLATGFATDLVWFAQDPMAEPAGRPLGAVIAGRLLAGDDLHP